MTADYGATSRGAPEYEPCSFPWLTVEVALYAALVAAAVVLRLASLGRFPLSAPEADTALYAWRTIHGGDQAPAASRSE